MKITETGFEGLVLIEPKVFSDSRGQFFESYNSKEFNEIASSNIHFVQDNISISHKNVLRGMHFQDPPSAQAKLIQVLHGAVYDVVIDLRKKSHSFGKFFTSELSSKNNLQLFIPKGFAHGFLTLQDNTIFQYKCDSLYNQALENAILWKDPDLDIPWPIKEPIVSNKDGEAKLLKDLESKF